MKRTKLQNAIIHAQKNASGISDENYRALIFNLTNGRTETSSAMDAREADKLIEALGGTPPPRGNGVSRRTQQRRNKAAGIITLATPEQVNVITNLAITRWGEGVQTAAALGKLVQRILKTDKIKTSQQAQKVIEALKVMNTRDAKKAKEAA